MKLTHVNSTVIILLGYLTLPLAPQALAVCYKHLQVAENDEAFLHIDYSRERSILHSSLRQFFDSSLLPAELPYLARNLGIDTSIDSVKNWVTAAIRVRSKRIRENTERVSFVLEDASLIQNQIETFWDGMADTDADFSYNRSAESEITHSNKIGRLQNLKEDILKSGAIPSLLALWEQLDGPKRGLDIFQLSEIVLLSNYYELLCPMDINRIDDLKDELRFQAMSYSELKARLLDHTLIEQLRELGHRDIPFLEDVAATYSEDLLHTAKSFVSAPLSTASNLWGLWKEFRHQLKYTQTFSLETETTLQPLPQQLSPEKQLAINRLVLEDAFHRSVRKRIRNDSLYYRRLLNRELDQDFAKEFLKMISVSGSGPSQ